MAAVAQPTENNRQRKIRSKKMSTRIDMTPMVDLAFLLLTFFMLTTTFNRLTTMAITMPEKMVADPPPINAEHALTLVLGDKNKVYWYMGVTKAPLAVTDFSYSGVRKLLMEKKSEIEKLYVFVKPSDQSRYQNMVDILDEIEITAIDRYSLVEITPEDTRLIKDSGL
jgi:biopolymer transport protein ExbD